MNSHHEYLGDAVYASFDGYHVWLHLNSHDIEPLIALEPAVLARLYDYTRDWPRFRREADKGAM